MPVNVLLLRALLQMYSYYGDEFKVECPTGSGNKMTLFEVARELASRLTRIFLRNRKGERPVYGAAAKFQTDPHWRDLILFYEYFHGDNGAGLGASHQTGWTGLIAGIMKLFNTLKAEDVLERGAHGAVSASRKKSLAGSEKADVHATTLHDPLARRLVGATATDRELPPQARSI